jgi:glyoxylase-like metal-dependent hydrolase (beta-lactamase superfamily II)/rhodanese-related sulfurtransferase
MSSSETAIPSTTVSSSDEGSLLFRQYALGCLSLFSYMIADRTTGRAVVVDPQRDVSVYLDDARANGLSIERIVQTHFHADFLPGHLELAAATGAVITYGEGARAEFPISTVSDGERFELGDVALEFRATPGHTPESISIVVHDRPGAPPWGVLTGDALFIGDVGRPDLLASSGWTADQLARRLYRSLHDKLLTLPDATRVFPAHGAGSACGKHLADATSSTIGEQRATNYALRPMTEDEFVAAVSEGQPLAPPYFAFAARANQRRHALLDDHHPPPALDPAAVVRWRDEGAVIVDTRPVEAFAGGHLAGSINIPFDGRFAEYAGDVIRPDEPIVVVTEPGTETEARVRLARIGFDQVVGALADLDGLLAARPDLAATATRLAPAGVAVWRAHHPGAQILDVRNPSEQLDGTIPGASSVPLPALLERAGSLDPARPTLVYCAGGHRSSVAASLLRSRGMADVADLRGGFDAWCAAGQPVAQPAGAGPAA